VHGGGEAGYTCTNHNDFGLNFTHPAYSTRVGEQKPL
jgi:hypothetical protein